MSFRTHGEIDQSYVDFPHDFTVYFFNKTAKRLNGMYSSQPDMENRTTHSEPKQWEKTCMHIGKTESLRRSAIIEPIDKHMISAGTNFRFASFVQQELQLQFDLLT